MGCGGSTARKYAVVVENELAAAKQRTADLEQQNLELSQRLKKLEAAAGGSEEGGAFGSDDPATLSDTYLLEDGSGSEGDELSNAATPAGARDTPVEEDNATIES